MFRSVQALGLVSLLVAACGEPTPTTTTSNPLQAGPGDPELLEVFAQEQAAALDVLFVIDPLEPELETIVSGLPLYLDVLLGTGIDYHVGFTTTDASGSGLAGTGGRLLGPEGQRWIDPDTSDPGQLWGELLALSGGAESHCFDAISLALEEQEHNAGFFRPDAALHVVVISSRPDESLVSAHEFAEWFTNGSAAPRTFSALAGPDAAGYLEVAAATGGLGAELDVLTLGASLEQLGLLNASLQAEFFLSSRPDLSTIEVEIWTGPEEAPTILVLEELQVDGSGVSSGHWRYDDPRNAISFVDFVPEPGSQVAIRYQPVD